MARKDVAMVKPGQQQQKRVSSDKQDSSAKSNSNSKASPKTTPSNSRRLSKTSGGKSGEYSSYLSSDPNFAAFRARLDAIGLELRDIIGDGNCLFRALSDQLDGSDADHLKHREDVVRYMLKHENDFAPFVEDDVPFSKHIDELRQPGTFAGNDVIVAFARLHKVNIIIHQLDAPAIEIKGADDNARQLHISYHNGDHYSSIRRINDSTNKPVNIRLAPIDDDSNHQQPKKTASKQDFTDLDTVNHVIERTGCEDVELVKTSLADNDNNIDLAIDSVMAVLTVTRSDSAASSNDGDTDDQTTRSSNFGNSNGSGQLKLPQKGRSQQIRTKKAEKKLRRMQERREQYLVSKPGDNGGESTKSDNSSNNNSQSEVVIINSAKLNIVSV